MQGPSSTVKVELCVCDALGVTTPNGFQYLEQDEVDRGRKQSSGQS